MQALRQLGYGQGAPPLATVTTSASGGVASSSRRRGGLNPKQRRLVKNMIKSSKELNYYNYTIAVGTDVNTTAQLGSVVVPTQGDGETQRINDKIEPTVMHLKAHVRSNVSEFGGVRYIVFRWKPDNAVEAPTGASILAGDDMSHYVPGESQRKKFEVLWDKYIILSASDNPGKHKFINKKIKIGGRPIYFNEAGTTGKNMIYFMRVANTATANDIEHEVQIRSHYRDA